MQKQEDLGRILEEIESLEGYKIDSEAYKLELSFKIMISNFGHLQKAVGVTPTFSLNQKIEQHKYMVECSRGFVNFLGSAGAFKDHTRRFIKMIYGSPNTALGGKYQEKIKKEFSNDPLVQFIEALRNYYLHSEVPPLGILSRYVDGHFRSDFVLFLDQINLKSYPKAKKFIENQDDDSIRVVDLSEKYVGKTLFPWIMKEQGEFHKADFQKLEALKQRARDLLNKKHYF